MIIIIEMKMKRSTHTKLCRAHIRINACDILTMTGPQKLTRRKRNRAALLNDFIYFPAYLPAAFWVQNGKWRALHILLLLLNNILLNLSMIPIKRLSRTSGKMPSNGTCHLNVWSQPGNTEVF